MPDTLRRVRRQAGPGVRRPGGTKLNESQQASDLRDRRSGARASSTRASSARASSPRGSSATSASRGGADADPGDLRLPGQRVQRQGDHAARPGQRSTRSRASSISSRQHRCEENDQKLADLFLHEGGDLRARRGHAIRSSTARRTRPPRSSRRLPAAVPVPRNRNRRPSCKPTPVRHDHADHPDQTPRARPRAALAVLGAAPARADCYHNGQPVAEGTQIGGLVCQNGQWVGG